MSHRHKFPKKRGHCHGARCRHVCSRCGVDLTSIPIAELHALRENPYGRKP